MDDESDHESVFTSPRLRGEVGLYAKRKIRVRGIHYAFHVRGDGPSPRPSPRKSGARERS